MNTILKKTADILIDSGYAEGYVHKKDGILLYWIYPEIDNTYEPIQPFEDTIEGIHQLFVIWNYLCKNHQSLLIKCGDHVRPNCLSEWDEKQYIIDRTMWCLQELS